MASPKRDSYLKIIPISTIPINFFINQYIASERVAEDYNLKNLYQLPQNFGCPDCNKPNSFQKNIFYVNKLTLTCGVCGCVFSLTEYFDYIDSLLGVDP